VADVFISYSKGQRKITETLAQQLQAHGYSVWWDVKLDPGEDFGEIIQERLEKSKAAIVIWTRASVRSKWVRAEAQIAEASGKLIPVRRRNLSVNDIPPPYNILQTDAIEDIEAIVRALRSRGVHPRSKIISEHLVSDDPAARISAITQIAAQRLMEHFDRVIHCMLSDRVDGVRERAAWVLDTLNDARSIPALVKAIHDPCWGVRSAAGWALVHLGKGVRSDVEKVLYGSENRDAREMARMILQRL
jgi:HEAT repeat protein